MTNRRLLFARQKRTAALWIAVYPTVLVRVMLVRPLTLRLAVTALLVVPAGINITHAAVKSPPTLLARR